MALIVMKFGGSSVANAERVMNVARIVTEQGIKPIILSEQANQGRTIIEKFEVQYV